jgi:hypothetical protein
MAVQREDFAKSNEVRAFVDLTTIRKLFDDHYTVLASEDALQAAKFEARARERGISDHATIRRIVLQSNTSLTSAIRTSLAFLERAIVCDVIALDARALEGEGRGFARVLYNLGNGDRYPWLQRCQVPPAIYQAARREVVASRKELGDERWSKLESAALSSNSAEYYYDMLEKLYHDELESQHEFAPYAFAASGDSWERLLFYLELARAANCPVELSAEKVVHFKKITNAFADIIDVHAQVVGETRALRTTIRGSLYSDVALPIPPLADYIILTALDEKVGLLDAAMILRESQDAVAYRSWLRERWVELREGWALSDANAKAMRKLKDIVDHWQIKRDPREKIQFETRSLNIEGLPRVGWLAKLVGLKTPSFKDKVLNPPKYLRFISQWHNYLDVRKPKQSRPKAGSVKSVGAHRRRRGS